ncbi:MAG TPA: tRNA (adenosine(37)-N6)-threonylcarbamoyltransferase complex transferase subunit TsaD [Candidatus Saccharimonadales bacterium]
MRILGIESSCDETAAAIVDNGRTLISNIVQTQIDIHTQYGGVIPEIAARSHIEVILPVIETALHQGNSTWDDIDAIAVTYAPGLVGSLLVGTLTARTLALLKKKPLYPIHHVEGHVYANFLLEKAPEFPMLALIVSGGHSQLALFKDHGDYVLLGQTQDDAVGEAFDKVAKIIGLPYPGGPSIAAAAKQGNPTTYTFPKAKLQGAYDFSFSGLKTAVLRRVQAECGVGYDFPSYKLAERLDEATRNNFAASFQHVAIETLVDKTERAFNEFQPKSVVIAGGVAASQELRRQLSARLPIAIEYADPSLCTDNAAMIATLGYYYAQKQAPIDPRRLEVAPSLSMTQTAWAHSPTL